MKISEKLKLIRKTEGYTQVKLAKVLGITERSYQELEYGKTHPAGKTFEKLCKKFPEYTLWLMTGKTSGDQIDPFIKQEKSDKTA